MPPSPYFYWQKDENLKINFMLPMICTVLLQILTYHLWLLSLVSKFSFQLSKLIQWAAFAIEPFIISRMVDSWSGLVFRMIPDFSQQEQDSVGSLYRMNKNKLIKVLTYTNIKSNSAVKDGKLIFVISRSTCWRLHYPYLSMNNFVLHFATIHIPYFN
jgi:hypothetical protein